MRTGGERSGSEGLQKEEEPVRDPVIPGDSQGLFTKIGTDPEEIGDIHQILGASRLTFEGDEIGDATDPDSESGKRVSPFDSGPGDLGENVEPDSLDVSPYHPGTRIFWIPPGQKTIDPVFSQRRKDLPGIVLRNEMGVESPPNIPEGRQSHSANDRAGFGLQNVRNGPGTPEESPPSPVRREDQRSS